MTPEQLAALAARMEPTTAFLPYPPELWRHDEDAEDAPEL